MKYRRKKESTRRCDICNIDINRKSVAKHLRSKKHLERIRPDDMIIPKWLFKKNKNLLRTKIKKCLSLKQ